MKGDLVRGTPGAGWLHEEKVTAAAQFTLKLAIWEKLLIEASQAGRNPALDLRIGAYNLVVLAREDFEALTGDGETP